MDYSTADSILLSSRKKDKSSKHPGSRYRSGLKLVRIDENNLNEWYVNYDYRWKYPDKQTLFDFMFDVKQFVKDQGDCLYSPSSFVNLDVDFIPKGTTVRDLYKKYGYLYYSNRSNLIRHFMKLGVFHNELEIAIKEMVQPNAIGVYYYYQFNKNPLVIYNPDGTTVISSHHHSNAYTRVFNEFLHNTHAILRNRVTFLTTPDLELESKTKYKCRTCSGTGVVPTICYPVRRANDFCEHGQIKTHITYSIVKQCNSCNGSKKAFRLKGYAWDGTPALLNKDGQVIKWSSSNNPEIKTVPRINTYLRTYIVNKVFEKDE